MQTCPSRLKAYSDILLDLNTLDVDNEWVTLLVVVLDSMVAVRVSASSVEAREAHVQSAFVILLRPQVVQPKQKVRYDRYVRPLGSNKELNITAPG